MLPRSYLFVPGNRSERFDKACAAGADAVIVDLEDAVPPSEKAAARASLTAWLSPLRQVLVRINSFDSAWFEDDLALCAMPGVAGIVLPKAEVEAAVARVAGAGAASILPLIESGLGLWNAAALARLPRVERLVFGSIDYSLDLNIQESHETLLHARSQLVLASRVAGIAAPVDGVTTSFGDPARVHTDAMRARALGFGAKLCIHPKQIGAVHQAFAPTAQEVDWANRVVAAAAAAQGGAVAVDGRMVDRPVILIAQQMLEEAQRRN
jgi:citrate lyase subunit beta/citryl-CoA lyase